MTPTPEQQAVINHDPAQNGRVLAGPGTGKSWTSVLLIKRLAQTHPHLRVQMFTFTRAATGELIKKFGDAKLEATLPSTIHAFALSLLLKNPRSGTLPHPLRIPDSWEAEALIRPDIARRLRLQGFKKTDVRTVDRLERELASKWESLDKSIMLLADIDPELRNAYVGLWEYHRRVFGYTLLAELPFQAGKVVEDLNTGLDAFHLLIVDEYQDLNEADIKLIYLFARKGIRILAIGDDDQSIYGFRMAAPAGIRRFLDEFGNCCDYELTISQRCGPKIVNAATTLIQTAPGRPRKKRLTFKDGAYLGYYSYLRFSNEKSEAKGVADLIETRIRAGVPAKEIAVLVRSNVHTWAEQLIPLLNDRNINAVDVDWAEDVLQETEVRRGLALIRLALHREDSLAWWTLLKSENGIGEKFFDYVYSAIGGYEMFGQVLLRLHPDFTGAPTIPSAKCAARLITSTLLLLQEIQIQGAELGETGWGGWVLQHLNLQHVSAKAIQLFQDVGRAVPVKEGLSYFLGQLEPVGKDLAAQSNAIRIMSMTASKGLTVDTCIVMGVENGIMPLPRANIEEERRLLYVAMTRATKMSVLTFARRRRGPTARHGTPNVNRDRERCPLLRSLPIGDWEDGETVIEQLKAQL